MKYEHVHSQIIERARLRQKPSEYCERHHVVPKSMGGTNGEENLVWLTGREHYLVHWLLFKIHRNKQTCFAWYRMTACGRVAGNRYTSHTFVYAVRARAARVSEMFSGKKISEAHRVKLSLAKKGKTYQELGRKGASPLKGRALSADHVAALKIANRGRTHSEESRQKLSHSKRGALNPNYGKQTPDDVRTKIAEALRTVAHKRDAANLLTVYGEIKNVASWARHPLCTVTASAILVRLAAGWSHEDAVFFPKRTTRHKLSAEELRAIKAEFAAKLRALKETA